ncbi:MAG: KH domain-containing protein [Patescibacteria group bacterium]|jgi:spoIIIJ-associated protein|nr:KH domain-containing protein [Patescibacteria group bacterium]
MSATIAKAITQKLLGLMGVESEVIIQSEEPVYLNVESKDSALLIGKGGESLRSLQFIINNMYHRTSGEEGYVGIDIAGYKKERVEKVQGLAQELSQKVLDTGHEEHLKPMNSFERRSVHTLLANEPDIVTDSEGEGESRHVVIRKR